MAFPSSSPTIPAETPHIHIGHDRLPTTYQRLTYVNAVWSSGNKVLKSPWTVDPLVRAPSGAF